MSVFRQIEALTFGTASEWLPAVEPVAFEDALAKLESIDCIHRMGTAPGGFTTSHGPCQACGRAHAAYNLGASTRRRGSTFAPYLPCAPIGP
jgi:hypothetical protein